MDKHSQNFDGERQHPPQDEFLLYLDGELAPRAAQRWETHLDACWPCRVQVADIEETISDIIKFDDTVSRYQASHTTFNWGNFDSMIDDASIEFAGRPFRVRFVDFLKDLTHFRFVDFRGRLAIPAVAALLIVAVIYQLVLVRPISAGELLDRATAEQQLVLQGTVQPVVYRKLKVSERDRAAMLEVWNEIGSTKNKRFVTIAEDARLLSDYEAVASHSGLDPSRPLSADAFRTWRNSLRDKTDSIEQTGDNVKLTTIINAPRSDGDVTHASLVVRSSDWHAIAQVIEFKAADETKTIEVAEIEFKILPRQTLATNFFDESTANSKVLVTTAPGISPSPSSDSGPAFESEPGAVSTGTVSSAATADLEVEVMDLLNRAKADMGEQITVERENGVIHIRGIVDTDARKREILGALQPVAGNPAVRTEIQTLAEALAAEKGKKKGTAVTEQLKADSTSSAAESDLIQHFGSVEAARAFASQMVARSSRAMNHAYALRRLTDQFKPAELNGMSAEARGKFLALIAQHANAFAAENAGLRGELQSVFGNGGTGSNAPEVNGIGDLPRAVTGLLNLAQANDRILRSAMTVSAEGPQFSSLRTPQFWQSLRSAESLASRIAAVK